MLELTNSNILKLHANKKPVRQALILAAGLGSRLAKNENDIKPLRQVGGKSLITRNIETLANAGVREVIIVTGYHAEKLQRQIKLETRHCPIKITFQFNPEYKKNNGISVLAAKKLIHSNFILMMADHIFEPALLKLAANLTTPAGSTVLCVDYKLHTVFDMDDATKVRTDGTNILNIGKNITEFNAVDTGLFIASPNLFNALEIAKNASDNDDCSLSQGIAALIEKKQIFVQDIKNAIWQDVDDEAMFIHAEKIVKSYPFVDSTQIAANA